MIPIRDTIPIRIFPLVTFLLIGACVLVFIAEMVLKMGMGPQVLDEFFANHGVIPAEYTLPGEQGYFWHPARFLPFLTFMFIHGGWLHLIGNMWFLYIFGDNIEDRLGKARYLILYLLTGITSALIQIWTAPDSDIPMVGASGAVAGVMGAYILMYPRARVLTLIPIFFFLHFAELPAVFFLGFWFVIQFFNGALSIADQGALEGGVAWWAHIGGFASGMALSTVLGRTIRVPRPSGSLPPRTAHPGQATAPRVSVLVPSPLDVRASLTVSASEAAQGTKRTISVRERNRKKTFVVTVPAGATDGTILRLRGLGRKSFLGKRGDLLLRLVILG